MPAKNPKNPGNSSNPAREACFDGLIGPTHNYAGLSYGNVASTSHRATRSNPREAALQGLRKMRALHDLGVPQAILPPQERPDTRILRRLGFTGTDAELVTGVYRDFPEVMAQVSSASSMWAANAATVSPSADTADGRVHFTPANLGTNLHRSLEPALTGRALRAIFADDRYFAHHDPLPTGGREFADEGAANHTRLAAEYGGPGVELFVFGRYAFRPAEQAPRKYPARQSAEASQAVARLHGLDPAATVFLQQDPEAIDAGAFHNDVVSVGNLGVLFAHARAFLGGTAALTGLRETYRATTGAELRVVEVPEKAVSLADAVRSYLFNTQLVSPDGTRTVMVAPVECGETPAVRDYLESMLADPARAIHEVRYVDVRQSMQNGGGPACLRLRVVLTEAERRAVAPGVWLDEALRARLEDWVIRNYRDRVEPADLGDPALLRESRAALDELTGILGLGSIYPFQGA